MEHRHQTNGEKIIRGKIPALAAAEGVTLKTRIVQDEEKTKFLKLKIIEEATEALGARSGKELVEELADNRQAIIDLCAHAGIRPVDLQPLLPSQSQHTLEEIPALLAQLHERAVAMQGESKEQLLSGIADVLSLVQEIADIAGIRDHVRTEVARKFRERGGFEAGIVLQHS